MEINNNTFIDILGLPEWDDRVLEVLDFFGEKRPKVEAGEIDYFMTSEKYGIEILFDDDCTTPAQISLEADGNLYVNQIAFFEGTILNLPFGIKMGDSHEEITSKIGRITDIPRKHQKPKSLGWALGGDEKPFWLSAIFENNKKDNLVELFMRIQLPYKYE